MTGSFPPCQLVTGKCEICRAVSYLGIQSCRESYSQLIYLLDANYFSLPDT